MSTPVLDGGLLGSPFDYQQALKELEHQRRPAENTASERVYARPCWCLGGSLELDSAPGRCSFCGHDLEPTTRETMLREQVHAGGLEDLWMAIELTRLALLSAA